MQSTPLGFDTMTDATGYRWVEKNGGWKWNGTSIALFGPGVFGALFINSDQAPNNPRILAALLPSPFAHGAVSLRHLLKQVLPVGVNASVILNLSLDELEEGVHD
jgi:hypothetical protein